MTQESKPMVICVDDEKMVLDALQSQLWKHFGDQFEYEFAESGQEALEILEELQEKNYPLVMVITDQIMPGMGGDELLAKIEEIQPDAVKIMLTGQAALESAINAINNANLYRYLTKPWIEGDFILTVERGVQQYNLKLEVKEQLETFQKFVPGEFIEFLGKEKMQDIQLSDHVEQNMNTLVCQIQGFGDLSDQLTPDENFHFLNTYLKLIEGPINQNKGIIEKYLGDTIIVLFQDADQAIRAGSGIQRTMRDAQTELSQQFDQVIKVGVGIHWGKMMLGIVGVEKRLQSTVISDSLEVAEDLERLTPFWGAKVVVSGELVEQLTEQDSYKLRRIGKIRNRRKRTIVTVYECLSAEDEKAGDLKYSQKAAFEEGLDLYYNQKFSEASVKFNQVLSAIPSDIPSKKYLEYCAHYMVNPVPEDWSGILSIPEKSS